MIERRSARSTASRGGRTRAFPQRSAIGGSLIALAVLASPAPAELTAGAAVQISRHPVPESRTPEVSARLMIDAPPAVVYSVVSDYDRFAQFVPDVRVSNVVRRQGPRRWVHQILELPSVLAAREHVLEAIHDESRAAAGSYRIEWHLDAAATSRLTHAEGVVATAAFSGRWDLDAANGGARTDATYVVRFDPGGPLPAWLVAFASRWLLPAVVAAVDARSREAAELGAAPPVTSRESDARRGQR